MKKITKLLFVSVLFSSLYGCASDGVERDFSYESLMDTIEGTPFRDRRYDYARQEVVESPSLKIPDGLSGEQIQPRFTLPAGANEYDASEVDEAQERMLPPDFDKDYDIVAVTKAQLSTLSISVTYDDKSNMKLIFREPLAKTLILVDDYLKDNTDKYTVELNEGKAFSGNLIRVKDLSNNYAYIVKIRKIDNLSSLVGIGAVMTEEGKAVDDALAEKTSFLTTMRKALNGIDVDNSDIEVKMPSKDDNKPLGGLSGLASSFGVSSYSKGVSKKAKTPQAEAPTTLETTSPQLEDTGDVYDSDSQPEEIS